MTRWLLVGSAAQSRDDHCRLCGMQQAFRHGPGSPFPHAGMLLWHDTRVRSTDRIAASTWCCPCGACVWGWGGG